MKGDGGAVRLTEHPAALQRWMLSGPEMARIIGEFQLSMEKRDKKADLQHHEQMRSVQVTFLTQVKSLSKVIEEMGKMLCVFSRDTTTLAPCTQEEADTRIFLPCGLFFSTGEF